MIKFKLNKTMLHSFSFFLSLSFFPIFLMNIPSHEASSGVMCNVSSGFRLLLTPITDGYKIDEIANTEPIFQAIKYWAELHNSCLQRIVIGENSQKKKKHGPDLYHIHK